MRGQIISNWSRERGRLRFEITVPANASAEFYVPNRKADVVTESGKPATSKPGIKFLRSERDAVVFQVASGHYQFEVSE